ncbi:hypothetical protein GCM10009567_04040 [Rothia amarae]
MIDVFGVLSRQIEYLLALGVIKERFKSEIRHGVLFLAAKLLEKRGINAKKGCKNAAAQTYHKWRRRC